jgi:Zn-dependent peptidase ImmA (M78 family)
MVPDCGVHRGDYHDKWRIERQAKAIRASLGLDTMAILPIEDLCDAVPAHVVTPDDLGDAVLARRVRRPAWDAFSFSYPDEPTLIIVMNPIRPKARQVATLMEELAHHLLGHRPSAIWTDAKTGVPRRDYDKAQEQEAYDLGAAILLPKERMQADIAELRVAHDIAREHGCSVEYVEYRIKRLRLWNRYSAYAA